MCVYCNVFSVYWWWTVQCCDVANGSVANVKSKELCSVVYGVWCRCASIFLTRYQVFGCYPPWHLPVERLCVWVVNSTTCYVLCLQLDDCVCLIFVSVCLLWIIWDILYWITEQSRMYIHVHTMIDVLVPHCITVWNFPNLNVESYTSSFTECFFLLCTLHVTCTHTRTINVSQPS